MNMVDTAKFIAAIHARPLIWKSDEKSYTNRLHRKQAWDEIAQEFSEDWENYSERRKDQVVEELQKKWRNLRDYHIKLRKKDKVLKRKANYLDMLNFLDINMDTTAKKRRRSVSDCESDEFDGNCRSHTSRVTEPNYEISMEPVIDTDAFQNSMLNVMPNMNEDPDRSFLTSILPDMKSMNENQKFKFKLEIMKLIEKIKYCKQSSRSEQRVDSVTEEEESLVFPKLEITDEYPDNSTHTNNSYCE